MHCHRDARISYCRHLRLQIPPSLWSPFLPAFLSSHLTLPSSSSFFPSPQSSFFHDISNIDQCSCSWLLVGKQPCFHTLRSKAGKCPPGVPFSRRCRLSSLSPWEPPSVPRVSPPLLSGFSAVFHSLGSCPAACATIEGTAG